MKFEIFLFAVINTIPEYDDLPRPIDVQKPT